jgi:hypothetical protein
MPRICDSAVTPEKVTQQVSRNTLRLAVVAAGAVALWWATALAQGLTAINAPGIAHRLVLALQPARDEHAIVVHDPTYYPDLIEALELRLRAAGVSVTKLTFDAKDIAGLPEAQVVEKLRPLFEKADIFLWMPGHNVGGDLRWEKLLALSKARGIHFHWISSFAGKSQEEIRTLGWLYEGAILYTDYQKLARSQDRLIDALRGETLRITSPDGTDLRMTVARDAWFHKNDGDISPARARLAKSVRDREMEFPSGALRFIPDVASVEGKLVLKRAPMVSGTVTLEFRAGRATNVPPEWARVGGDVDKVGEIVLGTNPLLVPEEPLPSGELPYYGYGAGYVRVSLGDNWESGGANRSPGGRPLWLFLERATLEANGKKLIRNGQLEKAFR